MSRSQLNNNNPEKNTTANNIPTLIKGRIYSIVNDEEHFFFKRVLGDYDPSYIGYVYWGDLNLKEGSLEESNILRFCTLAKPYFSFITYPPLFNEIVDIVKGPSSNHYIDLGGTSRNIEYYYYPSLNVWNGSAYNPLPSEVDIASNNGEVPLGNYIKEDHVSNTKNMEPFEGDLILEGRFGSSIRFGSSNPRGKNEWSEHDDEGSPIMILSNGQSPQDTTLITEDINGDASSIYLTSNQNINNLDLACKDFTSLNTKFETPQPLSKIRAYPISPVPSPTLDPHIPDTLTEGEPSINPIEGPAVDDESQEDEDTGNTMNSGEGVEDLVKIPGEYEDNSKIKRKLYILPQRYSTETILITSTLATPLMKMVKAADKQGTRLLLNSAFRPPVDDVYLNGKLIQNSQKTIRSNNLLPNFRDKLSEPWKLYTTAIKTFTHPLNGNTVNVGDEVTLSSQGSFFSPKTAPSYRSKHGESLAIDIGSNGGRSDTYKWMCLHGWKYGFIRSVNTEPWHFVYKPVVAQKGPTAILDYVYKPNINSNLDDAYKNTHNRWNNVFGEVEPNWGQALLAFQEQEAQELSNGFT